MPYKEEGLNNAPAYGININAKRYGLELTSKSIKVQFRELLLKLSVKGKVVILLDEYDNAIIDFLEDPEILETNRSIMKRFYSILKAREEEIGLVLITGISQFSSAGIFSDLNNLRNITLLP